MNLNGVYSVNKGYLFYLFVAGFSLGLVACGGKDLDSETEKFGCSSSTSIWLGPTSLTCNRVDQLAEAFESQPETSILHLTNSVVADRLDLSLFSSQLDSLQIDDSDIKVLDLSQNTGLRFVNVNSEHIVEIVAPAHKLHSFGLANAVRLRSSATAIETTTLYIKGAAPETLLSSLVDAEELQVVRLENSNIDIERVYSLPNIHSLSLRGMDTSDIDLSHFLELNAVYLYDMTLDDFKIDGSRFIRFCVDSSTIQSLRLLGQSSLSELISLNANMGEIYIEDPTSLNKVQINNSRIDVFSYSEWNALTSLVIRGSQIPKVDLTDMVSLAHLELYEVGIHPDFSNNKVLSRLTLYGVFDETTKDVDFSSTLIYWLEISGSHLDRVVLPETFEYLDSPDFDDFGAPSPKVALLSHQSNQIIFEGGAYVERFHFSSMKEQSLLSIDFTSFESLMSLELTDLWLDVLVLSSFDQLNRFVTRMAEIQSLDLSGLDDIAGLKFVDSTIETLIAPDSFNEDIYSIKDYTYFCRRNKRGNNNFSFSDEMLCRLENDDG